MWPVAVRSVRVSIAFSPSVPSMTGRGNSLSSIFRDAVLGITPRANPNPGDWQSKVWPPDRLHDRISRRTMAQRTANAHRGTSGDDHTALARASRRQRSEISIDREPLGLAFLRVKLGRETPAAANRSAESPAVIAV